MSREVDREEPIGWFVVTGGRSRVDERVAPESLIFLEGDPTPDLQSELVAILQLCSQGPMSAFELSAHLHVPVGIVRILLGDLIDKGKVTARTMPQHQRDDVDFLGRVLDGLNKL